MCYDAKARPPFPTARLGAATGEDLVLTAADGNRFAAYIARPESTPSAWVIVLPDIRGLHQFYKDLALLFAEAGVGALAIDYFGRTAGLGARDDSFEFRPHGQQLHADSFGADLAAAVAAVPAISSTTAIFTVGFCMGGALSLRAGIGSHGFAGVIGFYAGLSRAIPGNQPILECAEAISCPVLGLFGGADQGIPVSEVDALDQALVHTGVTHQIVVYPNAPHSFFDKRWSEHAEASADAWQQMLRFVAAHSPAA